MKKIFLTLLALSITTTSLFGQTTGQAAQTAANAPTQWPNIIFASTAAVTAAIGIVLTSFDNGNPYHAH